MTEKKKRDISKRVLNAIREGLEEFEYYFDVAESVEIAGSATPVPLGHLQASNESPEVAEEVVSESIEPEERVEDDDTYDWDENAEDDEDDGYVNKEDIEIVVDNFISSLISSKIIRTPKDGRIPSFTQVFAVFFGEEDEIVKWATTFEESIEGYMDWISPDDMLNARSSFLQIREKILKMLGEKAHAK